MTDMTDTTDKYAQDGVNVAEGDVFSRRAGAVCKDSYGNNAHVAVVDMSRGHFRGPRGTVKIDLPDGCIDAFAPDGTGTKIICMIIAKHFGDIGYDLIAMTADDIARYGGLPYGLINVLDVASLGEKGDATNSAAIELIEGLGRAAKKANIVILQGETAELGICVGSDDPNAVLKANLAGTAFGVFHPDKMILGDTLAPGQIIMALRDGFRANGWSSVRKAFKYAFGDAWFTDPECWMKVREAATPSKIYSPFLTRLNGWYNPDFTPEINVHLNAHLTGGGVQSKLAEDNLFPLGLSAILNDLWEPPEIMVHVAGWRNMIDEECYRAFNGGQGMFTVIDPKDEKQFVDRAAEFGIEAKKAGVITRENTPQVRLVSKFTGNEVIYHPKN